LDLIEKIGILEDQTKFLILGERLSQLIEIRDEIARKSKFRVN
jgi:hypothetical protein